MIKYPYIPKDEISDWWRNKQKGGFDSFHVPLPSIADYPEDMKRIIATNPRVSYRGVVVPNHKIRVEIEHLPEPIIRLRGKKDNP